MWRQAANPVGLLNNLLLLNNLRSLERAVKA